MRGFSQETFKKKLWEKQNFWERGSNSTKICYFLNRNLAFGVGGIDKIQIRANDLMQFSVIAHSLYHLSRLVCFKGMATLKTNENFDFTTWLTDLTRLLGLFCIKWYSFSFSLTSAYCQGFKIIGTFCIKGGDVQSFRRLVRNIRKLSKILIFQLHFIFILF